jgi:hypothetical protein
MEGLMLGLVFLRPEGENARLKRTKAKCRGLSTPLRSGRDDGVLVGVKENKQQQRQYGGSDGGVFAGHCLFA